MVRALSRSSLWYWVCLSPVIGCFSSAMLPQLQWFWEWAGWDNRKTRTVEKLDSSGPCALMEMHQQQWCRRRKLQVILCAPRRRPWHFHGSEACTFSIPYHLSSVRSCLYLLSSSILFHPKTVSQSHQWPLCSKRSWSVLILCIDLFVHSWLSSLRSLLRGCSYG